MNLDALLLRLFDLFFVSGHLLPGFQAGQVNFLGAQAAGSAGAVKGNVAAAQHDAPLAHAGLHAHGSIPQEIAVQQHARQLAALHGQANTLVGAQSQQHGVIFRGQCLEIAHAAVGLHRNARIG